MQTLHHECGHMHRREFMNSALAGIASAKGLFGPVTTPLGAPDWRAAFPALSQQINGHPLTYLDTAANSLRPQSGIDGVRHFYSTDNANPGEKLHTLARRAHIALESSRVSNSANFGNDSIARCIPPRGRKCPRPKPSRSCDFFRGRTIVGTVVLGSGESRSNAFELKLELDRSGAR